MSIFTSLVSQVLDLGAGETVTIRKLSPRQLDDAMRARQLDAVGQMRAMREAMGPDLMDSLSRVSSEQMQQARTADPLLSYDRVTLLRHGVTAWTFDRPLDAETFEDLEDDAQTLIAGAILRLSRPSLYQGEAEQEAARKNA